MKKLFFAILAIIMVGCKDGKQEEINKLKAEVLEVHDRVMAERGTMLKLRKNLKNAAEKTTDSTGVFSKAAMQITAADDAMMEWMHQFKMPEEGTEPEEMITYLKSEKKRMMAIEEQSEEAVQNGEQALAANQPAEPEEEAEAQQ